MSSVLTVNGKSYMPATDAGKHFGYTKDYILMLAKAGKIDGQKIGNKWYVHLPSADLHFRKAKAEREERRKRISIERKAELRERTHTTVALDRGSRTAVLETIVVVIIGLSLGVTGYVGTSSQPAQAAGGYGFFENLAVAVYDLVSPEPETITETKEVPVEETYISANIATTTRTSLVIAPDELFTATTIESIENSFSDEVRISVDPKNPETGVIIPVFKERDGEAYRFLMVPVTSTP